MLTYRKLSARKWLCIPGGKSGFSFTGVSGLGMENRLVQMQVLRKQLRVGPINRWVRSVLGMWCGSVQGNEARGSVVSDVSEATQSLRCWRDGWPCSTCGYLGALCLLDALAWYVVYS